MMGDPIFRDGITDYNHHGKVRKLKKVLSLEPTIEEIRAKRIEILSMFGKINYKWTNLEENLL